MKNNRHSQNKVLTEKVNSSVKVNSKIALVWSFISNPVGLPLWVKGVKDTVYKSKTKSGVGTIREVIFDDDSRIEEHFVLWKPESHASYVAVKGLPLQLYFASYVLEKVNYEVTKVTWTSYIASDKMKNEEFSRFVSELKALYRQSLRNLRSEIEK